MKAKKPKTKKLFTKCDIRESLYDLKIPFTASISNNTDITKVYSGTPNAVEYVRQASKMDNKTLQLIRQVKSHADKQPPPPVEYTSADIKYIKFFIEKQKETFFDIFEIDINSAYWHIAYRLGYISKKIFELGNDREKTPKISRLIALGSMATSTRLYKYEGGNSPILKIGDKTNYKTRFMYFHICKTLDQIIEDCIEKYGYSNFLFYWVDAVFVKKEAAGEIQEFFTKEKNLGTKTHFYNAVISDTNGHYWYTAAQKHGAEKETKVYIRPNDKAPKLGKYTGVLQQLEQEAKQELESTILDSY